MKHLFLIRHAKARRDGTPDPQRPLRRRGQRQLAAMATPLQRLGAFAGDLHVSTATRAKQTLQGLDAALPECRLAGCAHHHEALYTFDESMLRRWLKATDTDRDTLAIIGHNPALLDLARRLVEPPPERLPTAGMLHITLPSDTWRKLGKGRGTLAESLTPEQASHALFKRRAPEAPKLSGTNLARRIGKQLRYQYRMIRALEPGVRAGWDPEFLHQYRVNLRRSRAITESLLAIASAPKVKKTLKAVKRRARATSRLRDLDVFLETLAKITTEHDNDAIPTVMAWLRQQAEAEHATLCRQLDSSDYTREMRDWRRCLETRAFYRLLAAADQERIRAVLEQRIARHDEQWRDLDAASPDEALHELRKTVKRIRYQAELAPDRDHDLLQRLKTRQELLGDFQDLTTQRRLLGEFSASETARHLSAKENQDFEDWCSRLSERHQRLRQEIQQRGPLGDVLGAVPGNLSAPD